MKSRIFPALLAVGLLYLASASSANAFELLDRMLGGGGYAGCGCEPTCCAPEPKCGCGPKMSLFGHRHHGCCDPVCGAEPKGKGADCGCASKCGRRHSLFGHKGHGCCEPKCGAGIGKGHGKGHGCGCEPKCGAGLFGGHKGRGCCEPKCGAGIGKGLGKGHGCGCEPKCGAGLFGGHKGHGCGCEPKCGAAPKCGCGHGGLFGKLKRGHHGCGCEPTCGVVVDGKKGW